MPKRQEDEFDAFVASVAIIGAVLAMKIMTKKSVTAAMIATLAPVAFELSAAAGPI